MSRDWSLAEKLWDMMLAAQIPAPETEAHTKAAVECLEAWLPRIEESIKQEPTDLMGRATALGIAGLTLLDVGCGTGFLADYVRKRGWAYWGISLQDGADVSDDYHFMSFDFALHHHGLVFARHVLEHSPFPLLALTKLYEFTAAGGWCIAIVPMPPYHITQADHYSELPRGGWAGLMQRVGFTIMQIEDRPIDDGSMEMRYLLRKAATP